VEMAETGLHRPNDQWLIGCPALPKACPKGFNLNWVTKRRTRTMRLNITNGGWLYACVLQCLTHNRLLGTPIRDGETTAASILVNSRAMNDGKNRIPCFLSI